MSERTVSSGSRVPQRQPPRSPRETKLTIKPGLGFGLARLRNHRQRAVMGGLGEALDHCSIAQVVGPHPSQHASSQKNFLKALKLKFNCVWFSLVTLLFHLSRVDHLRTKRPQFLYLDPYYFCPSPFRNIRQGMEASAQQRETRDPRTLFHRRMGRRRSSPSSLFFFWFLLFFVFVRIFFFCLSQKWMIRILDHGSVDDWCRNYTYSGYDGRVEETTIGFRTVGKTRGGLEALS